MIISFENCTVTHNDKVLFQPEWGVYDMAVGKEVVSAYAGAADINSFEDTSEVSKTKTHKIKYSDNQKRLYGLYDSVREIRNTKNVTEQKLNLFIMTF